MQSAALHILEIVPAVADGRQADQLRKNGVEMIDVGVADDGGDLRGAVIGGDEQVLRLADAAADHIMNRRHAGHVLEDVREMVRRHGERLADVLKRELLGEMRADVLADAVREHQIMRLVGGARVGRQTGGQQHQRRQQAVREEAAVIGDQMEAGGVAIQRFSAAQIDGPDHQEHHDGQHFH